MRSSLAPALVFALAMAGSAGGCAGCGQQPAAAPAASGKPGPKAGTPAPKPASLVAIEGTVFATATLISDKGGGVVSNNGASIVSNNSAGIVSTNSGALTGKAKYLEPAHAPTPRQESQIPPTKRFLLAQAPEPWRPVEQAEVALVDAAERPAPGVAAVRTDGTGRYRLNAPPGTWLVRVKANGARLSALARVGAGGTTADVSPATTVVAEYVRDRAGSSQAAIEQLGEAAIAALVAQVKPVLEAGTVALDLSSAAAAVEALTRAAAAEPAVKRQADAVATELGEAAAKPAAASPVAASPGAASPGAASPATTKPTSPVATSTPDPLAGALIAGTLLDPKVASEVDAADARGVEIGAATSMAVTADGTVFFTSPADRLRAITPAGAYVAAPLGPDRRIGSQLTTDRAGRLLFADQSRKAFFTVDAAKQPWQAQAGPSLAAVPFKTGDAIAVSPAGDILAETTLIKPDGRTSDLLASNTGLAELLSKYPTHQVRSLAYDKGGSLYIAIRTVPAALPTAFRFVGSVAPFSFSVSEAAGLAVDASSRPIADRGAGIERRAGSGSFLTIARPLGCRCLALAPDGTLYFADYGAIRRLTPAP